MLGWFKRRLGIKPTAISVYEDVLTVEVCGEKRRYDPLEVWRTLEKAGTIHWADMLLPLWVAVPEPIKTEKPNESLEAAYLAMLENIHSSRQHSIETLAGWVRQAFKLKTFDEGGPTDTKCMNLLAELFVFTNKMEAEFRPFLIFRKRDAPFPSIPSDAPKD